MAEPELEPRFGKSRPRALSTTLQWKRILLNVHLVKTDYYTSKEEISVRVCKRHGELDLKTDQDITKFYFPREPKGEDPMCNLATGGLGFTLQPHFLSDTSR